jgi:hypothetical protein
VRAKKIAAILAAAAALVALVLPGATSAAKGRTYKVPASTLQLVELKGTHGFKLNLTVEDHGIAFLSASSFASHPVLTFVTYSIPKHPHTEPDALALKVGDEGSFEGTFVAKSVKHEAVSSPCHGEPSTVETGFFVGRFDFRGGGHFTAVHRTRAAGNVIRSAPQVCRGLPKSKPGDDTSVFDESEEEAHELRLIAGRPNGDPEFQASRYEEAAAGERVPPSTTFIGGVNRTSHGVEISSNVVILGSKASAFQVPDLTRPSSEATVAPPAPFSGSATFMLGNPAASRWTGDLAVELPVFGKVALTGPTIAAGVCGTPGKCTKTLPPAMRPDAGGAFTGNFFGS